MTDLQEWPGHLAQWLLTYELPLDSAIEIFIPLRVLFSGAGCMVAAICGSTEKEPIVVGKPATFMMDFLLEK